jgi:hypothetical protein
MRYKKIGDLMEFTKRFRDGLYLASDSFELLWEHKILLTYIAIPAATWFIIELIAYNFVSCPDSRVHLLFGLDKLVCSLTTSFEWQNYFSNLIINLANIVPITFFQAALIHHALRIMHKKRANVRYTLQACLQKWRILLAWALIATFVISILQLPSLFGGSLSIILMGQASTENLHILMPMAIIALMLSMLWSFVTYLILPIITTENLSLIQALKLSESLTRRYFAEILGGIFWIGLIALMTIAPCILIESLLENYASAGLAVIVASHALILISCILSTVHILFKTKIYYQFYKRAFYELEEIMHQPF